MTEPLRDLVVVGVDCATSPKNVGLARVVATARAARVDELATAASWEAIEETVAGWLGSRTIIALDAPLGWPRPLGDVLSGHRAGGSVASSPNAMFRRTTDEVVIREIGKRPLDVGADRIARTAHAALSFLERLRVSTALPIPLAWAPGRVEGTSAIEVYPAATLAGRGLPHTGYKGAKDGASDVRRDITSALAEMLTIDTDAIEAMAGSDHVLDAAICGLAALDFARGDVIRPTDAALAEREGWIWVRAPA